MLADQRNLIEQIDKDFKNQFHLFLEEVKEENKVYSEAVVDLKLK